VKTLLGLLGVIALAVAGYFAAPLLFPQKAARTEIVSLDGQGDSLPIAIPETLITLKHALQWKENVGNPALVLEAGTQLVTSSTQGLDYIVTQDGRTFRIHCDDAFESHGRFTDGRVAQLAAEMAAEIRAMGKVPTNERIASRAQEALEQQRLNPSLTDPASLVDSLQRGLLVVPAPDQDGAAFPADPTVNPAPP
jgi:hypothetical protein